MCVDTKAVDPWVETSVFQVFDRLITRSYAGKETGFLYP